MLKNKLTTLTTAGLLAVLSSSVWAAPMPSTMPMGSTAGVYVEGNFGYADYDWGDVDFIVKKSDGTHTSVGVQQQGGAGTLGFDAGYQFNQYFSLEMGWYYLPKLKVESAALDGSGDITSWFLYGALKGQLPVYDNTFLFMKAGLAYTKNQFGSAHSYLDPELGYQKLGNQDHVSPIFAVGIQYYFSDDLYINGQYTYIPGEKTEDVGNANTPNANLFTLGVGYKFVM